MKHIQIFEKFGENYSNEPELVDPMEIARKKAKELSVISEPHFEVETDDVVDLPGDAEASFLITFKNREGSNTTLEVGSPLEPEIAGNAMVSRLDVLPEGTSDGNEYSVIGYFSEVPNSKGAYEIKKALIEEL